MKETSRLRHKSGSVVGKIQVTGSKSESRSDVAFTSTFSAN